MDQYKIRSYHIKKNEKQRTKMAMPINAGSNYNNTHNKERQNTEKDTHMRNHKTKQKKATNGKQRRHTQGTQEK